MRHHSPLLAPVQVLILILAGCSSSPESTAREELSVYLAARPDITFDECAEAELDDCTVNPDTAFPSAAVLDCVYAAKQTCTPTWGCVPWVTFDAEGEFCLLVEEGTCDVITFNPGTGQACESMVEPEDCWPTLGDCEVIEGEE